MCLSLFIFFFISVNVEKIKKFIICQFIEIKIEFLWLYLRITVLNLDSMFNIYFPKFIILIILFLGG